MLVDFITDEPTKLPAIRAMLEPRHEVVAHLLGDNDARIEPHHILIVDVDLRQACRIDQLRPVLQQLNGTRHKLFVVHNLAGPMAAQARALGATAVISSAKQAVFRIAWIEDALEAGQPRQTTRSGLDSSTAAFASMFVAARSGKPISFSDAAHATSQIVDRVQHSGLTSYLDEVRRYHEGTFQHCLLVTGVAAGFAVEIGFSPADISRLGIAATLHDIGKSAIPLEILDKPGRLDPDEDQIMKRHPVTGYDMLKDISGMTPEILDGIRHHHEYLDGSGYPDKLAASEISDLVRLLTISDIFAALIETRSYKKPMPRPTAYQILCDMNGKLESSLVRAFKSVALAA